MSALKRHIVAQFARPTGLLGRLAGTIMARRASNRLRNARTVELMELTPGLRVLELGCGPGLALLACARITSRVTGLDHSPVMLAQARARLAREGLADRVTLIQGGLDALPGLGPFDRIVSLNVIQFLPDKPAAYRALHTALAPGGLCLTTYQPRLESDARSAATRQTDAIIAAMQTAGFTDITAHPILTGEAPATCITGRRA